MPGEVTLAHQVGKDFMPVTGGSQVAYVLVEARPTEMMAQVRMPLNFALVLDHSGSMKGAKLKNVKEAVKMVIGRLEPTDYVSVVIFDDTSQVIIPSMPANDKPGMQAAIDQIRDAGGTTSVTYGDSDRCRQLARDAASAGISIYPLGIGADWDEDLLDSVGQLSGGMPAEFIRNATDALTIFEQQLQSAVDVAIRNASLILRLPVGVSPKKAVKVLPIISDLGQSVLSDRQVVIPLGDLEKDKPQSVLVELMIDPRPAGLFRIMQAELSYDVPIANLEGEKIRDDIKVTFTMDANQSVPVNA